MTSSSSSTTSSLSKTDSPRLKGTSFDFGSLALTDVQLNYTFSGSVDYSMVVYHVFEKIKKVFSLTDKEAGQFCLNLGLVLNIYGPGSSNMKFLKIKETKAPLNVILKVLGFKDNTKESTDLRILQTNYFTVSKLTRAFSYITHQYLQNIEDLTADGSEPSIVPYLTMRERKLPISYGFINACHIPVPLEHVEAYKRALSSFDEVIGSADNTWLSYGTYHLENGPIIRFTALTGEEAFKDHPASRMFMLMSNMKYDENKDFFTQLKEIKERVIRNVPLTDEEKVLETQRTPTAKQLKKQKSEEGKDKDNAQKKRQGAREAKQKEEKQEENKDKKQ